MTQPTVDLPVVGTVQRRWVYVSVGAVALIVGYAYWARSRSASGGGGVVYDPATGSVGGPAGYVNPAPHSPDSGEPVDSGQGGITTRDQWGAAATAALAELGWEPQFAAATIGRYLAGEALVPSEVTAVRAAQAAVGLCPGNPPVIVAPNTTNPPPSSEPPPPSSTPDMPTGYPLAPGSDLYQFALQVRLGQLSGMPHGIDGYTYATFQSLNPGVATYKRTTLYGPNAPHNVNAIFARIR